MPYNNHSNPQAETQNLARDTIGYPRFGKEMGDQGTQRDGASGNAYERKVSYLQGSCDIAVDWQMEIKEGARNGAQSVQQTTDGGYIMTGDAYASGNFRHVVYLYKTNASGNSQWERTFGTKEYNAGYSAQQTADGGYVIVGETHDYGRSGDVYLIKTDASGNKQWEKTFNRKTYVTSGYVTEDGGYSVQQTTDGGYIIAGYTSTSKYENTHGGGIQYRAVYLIKTDTLGNKEWEKVFGGAETDTWDGGSSVQQTKDGGYIVAGVKDSAYAEGKGTWDVYLIKTDSLGNKQWENTYGGDVSNENGMSGQQTTDGGYIVTGSSSSKGVYLVKTDASGAELWEKTFAGEGIAIGRSVQQTKDGGYIIGGGTGMGFPAKAYLIKTDAEGNAQWENTFAGGNTRGYSSPSTAKQTTDGGYIIAGAYDFYNILLVKRVADDICSDKNLGLPRDGHTSQGGQVNVANGNMYIISTDISTPHNGPVPRNMFPFEFTRSYNSYNKQNGPFGYGWTHNYNIKIYPPINGESLAIIHDIDGRLIYFTQNTDGSFQPVGGEHSTLTGNEPMYEWKKRMG